jgi:uncharacterized Zn finger protein
VLRCRSPGVQSVPGHTSLTGKSVRLDWGVAEAHPLASVLTDAELRRLAYGKSYGRGRGYFERGAVESLAEVGDRLSARVRGAELYEVRLWSEGGLACSCTCPVGSDGLFCKHCVAAGLEWLERQREEEPLDEPDSPAPPDHVTFDELRAYVNGQSAETLAGLVMRHAELDPEFAEQLMRRAAASRPGGPGVPFLRKAIMNATRVHGALYGRAATAFAEGIRAALEPVLGLAESGRGAEAMELAEHAVKRMQQAMNVDDSEDGCMSEVLAEVQDLHLAASRAAKPDPEVLARWLYQTALESDWDLFLDAAETYAGELGERGRAKYRRLAEAAWRRLPALEPGQEDPPQRDADRFRLSKMMEALARTSGDVDELARVLARDLSCAYRFLEIAQVYKQAGKPDKALEWAERGLSAFPRETNSRLREFLFEEYLRLERRNDAMNIAWAEFTDAPCPERFADLKQRAERVGQWPVWREEALEFLRERAAAERKKHKGETDWGWGYDSTTGSLVEILLAEGQPDAAWREAAGAELQADEWLKLAEAREEKHPTDAADVYRRYVEYLMSGRLGNRYEEAVRYLVKAAKLAARTGRYAQFERYLTDFRARYKRKWSLMMLLDSTRWPGAGR